MRISDWSSDVCSSDLPCAGLRRAVTDLAVDPFAFSGRHGPAFAIAASELAGTVDRGRRGGGRAGRCLLVELAPVRSEEHTSELQSLMRTSYAVFCLKKKKKSQQRKENSIAVNQYTNT